MQKALKQLAIVHMMQSYQYGSVIGAAEEIGVFEALRAGGRTARDLSQKLEANEGELERLLRGLICTRLISHEGSEYSLTEDGQVLSETQFLRDEALLLSESLMNWATLSSKLFSSKVFVSSRTSVERRREEAKGRRSDISASNIVSMLEDLGCLPAQGVVAALANDDTVHDAEALMRMLLGRFPHLRLSNSAIRDTDVLFSVKHISRMSDEKTTEFLADVFSVCDPGTRLVIVEMPFPEKLSRVTMGTSLLDLEVLLSGGRLRSTQEIADLVSAAGFVNLRMFNDHERYSVVVADAPEVKE